MLRVAVPNKGAPVHRGRILSEAVTAPTVQGPDRVDPANQVEFLLPAADGNRHLRRFGSVTSASPAATWRRIRAPIRDGGAGLRCVPLPLWPHPRPGMVRGRLAGKRIAHRVPESVGKIWPKRNRCDRHPPRGAVEISIQLGWPMSSPISSVRTHLGLHYLWPSVTRCGFEDVLIERADSPPTPRATSWRPGAGRGVRPAVPDADYTSPFRFDGRPRSPGLESRPSRRWPIRTGGGAGPGAAAHVNSIMDELAAIAPRRSCLRHPVRPLLIRPVDRQA